MVPAALCYTFGVMIGDRRQGWAVFIAMSVLFVPFVFYCTAMEQHGNPRIDALGVTSIAGDAQPGGNMEGKEARFGIANSTLWATATTVASNGSVNAMHDSFTPLGGLVPLLMIQFGEVVYGGVGSGLYGMLIFVIIAVFIAGLMVGRTPEYLGKKIGVFEMKMASVGILVMPITVLFFTSLAVLSPDGLAGLENHGPHGFSEILYAFTSAGNNNGSAFAGLTANAPFYDTWLGIAMLLGRFFIIVPVLAIAGSMAAKMPGAALGRNALNAYAALHRLPCRHRGAGRRANLRAGAGARPRRRAPHPRRRAIAWPGSPASPSPTRKCCAPRSSPPSPSWTRRRSCATR